VSARAALFALPTAKNEDWLVERAAKVGKVLQEMPIESEKVWFMVLTKLCDSLCHRALPYGVLLGWMFQTGCAIDQHEFVNDKGHLTLYTLPTLQEGEQRQDQLRRVCHEGALCSP